MQPVRFGVPGVDERTIGATGVVRTRPEIVQATDDVGGRRFDGAQKQIRSADFMHSGRAAPETAARQSCCRP